jgi:hypothetical protein
MAGETDLPAGGPPGSAAGEQHEQSAMAQVGQALKHIAGLLENIHGKLGGGAAPAAAAAEPAAAEPAAEDLNLTPAVAEGSPRHEGAEDEADEPVDEGEGAMDEGAGEGDYPMPRQAAQEGTPARGNATPHGAMDAATVRKVTQAAVAAAVQKERKRAADVERAKRETRGVLGDVYGMDSAAAIYREALAAVGIDPATVPKGMARVAWNTHVQTAARTAGARPASLAMDAVGVEKTQATLLAHLNKIAVKG